MSYGGAETLLVQLMNLQCENNSINLIVVNDITEEGLIKKIDPRVNIHFLRRPSGSKNPFYFVKLSCLLLFLKNDIVHFHQDNLIEYIPVSPFKKNFCLTVHCVTMDKKSLYKYSHLFAISKSVQKKIKENCGLDSTLIYNGINIRGFKTRERLEQGNGKFQIIQIGRLTHLHKGQDLLIKAADILINKYHFLNFTIRLIGEGDSKSYLQSLIDELGLSEFVILEGNKSFEYIRNNLCNHDLLVQPSRYEGFGLVAIEAMAAKVPVLISEVDGLAEIVQPNKYGYSFEPENVEDLAEKIREIMIESPHKIEALITSAYEYAYHNFDYSITSENYLKSYQKILGL